MKLIVTRDAFAEALEFSQGVVKTKTPKPALTAVKLKAVGKTLSMVATDCEIGMRWNLTQVDVHAEGEALIPADRLMSVVKAIDDDTITITTEGEATEIRSRNGKFKIMGYNPSELPPVETFEPKDTDIQVEGPVLSRMIEQTDFCIARDATRYALNALLFELSEGKLTLVSTDGHRLVLVSREVPTKGSGRYPVSKRFVGMLKSLLSEPDSVCRIQTQSNLMMVAVMHEGVPIVSIRSSLIEGNFPDYESVRPKAVPSRTAKVSKKLLETALRQASILTTEESHGVRFSFEQQMLTLTTCAPQIGTAMIDVPTELTGEAIEIGFNPDYMLDYLKTVSAEHVILAMNSPNKPLHAKADPNAFYMVMPINLTSSTAPAAQPKAA